MGVSGDEPVDQYFQGGYRFPKNTFTCKGNGTRYGECRVSNFSCLNLKWGHGDVVDIKLDLKERNIEYLINNQSFGVLYKDIPVGVDIKYRLVIYIGSNGSCATIEDFESL